MKKIKDILLYKKLNKTFQSAEKKNYLTNELRLTQKQ